jgi:hypothetical protein
MKHRIRTGLLVAMVLLFGALIFPGVTFADFLSEEGNWIISISGKRQGTAMWSFTAPTGGVSSITGTGFIKGMGKRFVVQDEPGQILRIESDGNIVTDLGKPLVITDTGGNLLGEFTIDHGTANAFFTSLRMSGTFTGAGEAPVKVNLKGSRIPNAIPILEGNTFRGKVSGGGLTSNHFPLNLVENVDPAFIPFNFYPLFSVSGVGGLKIDGLETPGVDIVSDFIITNQGDLIGDFTSSVLGVGEVTGSLKPTKMGPVFKMKVNVIGPAADKFNISAIISPIEGAGARLSVTPNDNPVNFGSVKTDQANPVARVFTLTSTGALGLSGEATIEGAGASAFTITSGDSYSISPTRSARMTVQFKPEAGGSFDATIRFTGDETGDILVNIRGVGVAP